MLGTQRLEFLFKDFLLLANLLEKYAYKSLKKTYLEEMTVILERSAMSRIVNSIRQFCLDRDMEIIPEESAEILNDLVKLRNNLAHNYLNYNFSLFKNDEARSMLITELKHYAEFFHEVELQFTPLRAIVTGELKRRGIWHEYGENKADLDKFEDLKSRLKANQGLEE
jgi:hypothetical protein